MLKESTLKKYAKSDLLERSDEGTPLFLHSASCPSYCDFACRADGSEIAAAIEAMEAVGARVGPFDVVKRLKEEYPDAEFELSDVKGLEATIEVKAARPRPIYARALALSKRAGFFNAHMDVGHRTRKTNWWKTA